jgi:hypothetical protein
MQALFRWIFVVSLLSATCAMAADVYEYAVPVSLSGNLKLKTFYGPPGYGETPKVDTKENQFVLTLDRPIHVVPKRGEKDSLDDPEDGVTEITLVSDTSLKANQDHHVMASGTLFHAQTGHHHTQVLMELKNIK